MRNPRRFIGLLLSIMGIIICLIFLGEGSQDSSALPSNYGPRGTAAFRLLLEKSGYQVSIDSNTNPSVPKGAVMVVLGPSDSEKLSTTLGIWARRGYQMMVFSGKSDARLPGRGLKADGGSALQFTNNLTGEKVRMNFNPNADLSASDLGKSYLAGAFLTGDNSYEPALLGSGMSSQVVMFASTEPIQNQYIDQADNARVVMETLAKFSQGNRRVVICTGLYGGGSSSIVASIGAWAQGAWSQFWIFLLVVFVANSVRFGLPSAYRAAQPGQRDTLDLIRMLLMRRKDPEMFVQAVRRRVLETISKRRRLTLTQIESDEKKYIPPMTRQRLADLENAELAELPAQTKSLFSVLTDELQRTP